MNKLKLHIEPSFESHDFQVKIVIDEVVLFPDLLGLDPADFFKQDFLKTNSEIIIARCECGIIGCFDTTSKIENIKNSIIWNISNSTEYRFNIVEYQKCIEQAKNDKKWETKERIIERIIGSEFINYKYLDKYDLDWVSLRGDSEEIKISFTFDNPKGYTDQEIVKINWNGLKEEDAINAVKNIRDTTGKFKRYQ